MNLEQDSQSVTSVEKECNSFVTDLCNRHHIKLTKKRQEFLKKAYYINAIQRRYFLFNDFGIPKGNFRTTILRLKPIIKQDRKSYPALYRLDGISITQKVTMQGTGVQRQVDLDFNELLLSCKQQPVMMHDLRLNTFSVNLYDKLVRANHIPNEQNKQITLKYALGDYIHSALNIFKNGRIQIMIGCSQKPILYSPVGFNRLVFYLGKLADRLEFEVGKTIFISPVDEWTVDYYHLNQDGFTIDSKKFNYTISQLSEHSQFYIKHFDDGTIRPRLERHESPHKTIAQLQNILSNQREMSISE